MKWYTPLLYTLVLQHRRRVPESIVDTLNRIDTTTTQRAVNHPSPTMAGIPVAFGDVLHQYGNNHNNLHRRMLAKRQREPINSNPLPSSTDDSSNSLSLGRPSSTPGAGGDDKDTSSSSSSSSTTPSISTRELPRPRLRSLLAFCLAGKTRARKARPNTRGGEVDLTDFRKMDMLTLLFCFCLLQPITTYSIGLAHSHTHQRPRQRHNNHSH